MTSTNPNTARLAHSRLFAQAAARSTEPAPTIEISSCLIGLVTVRLGSLEADLDYDADWLADGGGVSSELAVTLMDEVPAWLADWCGGRDEAQAWLCEVIRDELLADVADRRENAVGGW